MDGEIDKRYSRKYSTGRKDDQYEEVIVNPDDDPKEKEKEMWQVCMNMLKKRSQKLPPVVNVEKQRAYALHIKKSMEEIIGDRAGYKFITCQWKPEIPFNKDLVVETIKSLVLPFCDRMRKFYENDSNWIAECLSGIVLDGVTKLNFNRHKPVVMVRIFENLGQYRETLINYLWRCEFDGHAHFTYDGPGYTIVVSVITFYVE